jgi:hypothetical protein
MSSFFIYPPLSRESIIILKSGHFYFAQSGLFNFGVTDFYVNLFENTAYLYHRSRATFGTIYFVSSRDAGCRLILILV